MMSFICQRCERGFDDWLDECQICNLCRECCRCHRHRRAPEMDVIISDGYFFSVDEDGIPDHQYVGLVDDSGAPPPDVLKKRRKS